MAKSHTIPFRLYKRDKSPYYYAYISFVASNGERINFRGSTGEILSEKASEWCIKYITSINRRIKLGNNEEVEISTEQACIEFYENKAKYYNSAKDTFGKLQILLKFFSHKSIAQISDADIMAFIRYYKENNRSNGTINRYLATLGAVLTYAADRGYTSPKIKISKYKQKEKAENIKYLKSWAEAQRIIDRAAPHLKPIIYVALYTGMRLGNILNLKWENIDFTNKSINITVKDKTKDGGKNLSIPMVEPCVQVLHNLPKDSEYVFTYKGKKINKIETAWQSIFYYPHTKILRDESLPYINFHTLRHTAGTWILKTCGNLKITQQILGHSDIKTTLKYAHVLDEQKREALDKLYTSCTLTD